jgi:hypothetical protein
MRFAKDLVMVRSYDFAIIRLAPADARKECLNIGIMAFGEREPDIRISKSLEKVKAISGAIDIQMLGALVGNLSKVDAHLRGAGVSELDVRLREMSRIEPLSISRGGTFIAENAAAYEARLGSIVKNLVDPEPAPPRQREKRSKLLNQVKKIFRLERVLAKNNEDLSSHRILTSYVIDEGLVADLILRNGSVHVVETIDASGDETSLRRTVGEIGVAALVLERVRMKFDGEVTKARLVYNASASLERIARPSLDAAAHQGAELVNWASSDQRSKFVQDITSLAVPFQSDVKARVGKLPPLVDGKLSTRPSRRTKWARKSPFLGQCDNTSPAARCADYAVV